MNTRINFKLQRNSLFRKCSFFVMCIIPLSLHALVPRNPNGQLSSEDQRWASRLNQQLEQRFKQEEQIQQEPEVVRKQKKIIRRLQREERKRAELARVAAIGALAARIAEEERAIVHNYLRYLPGAQTDTATIGITISMLPVNIRNPLRQQAVARVERQLQEANNRRRVHDERATQNPGAPKRGRR
ncbi:hypothetical protein JST99_01030 [Candidatus Dependentiae bacterium]|nr:hypothetical protein [Candidatus Dependentiae bacterium]MCC7414785.1 hypothetical protein [Campylobacterota bacterium]